MATQTPAQASAVIQANQDASNAASAAKVSANKNTLPTGVGYQTYNPDGSVKQSLSDAQTKTMNATGTTPATAPATGLNSATTPPAGTSATNPAPVPNPEQTGAVSFEQAQKNLAAGGLTGSDLASAQKSLATSYNQGQSTLDALNASGAAPQDKGTAMSQMSSTNPPAPDTTVADTVLADNKAHQKYIDDFTQSQASEAQNKTLTQTYTDLTNQLGIPALNTQLMNMKNVIDGTEDDIRNEVTKAGGFATDSQVLALSNARNKTMIQNYNNLLETRNNAQQNLTTMIGLATQDRALASAQIDKQLNFDQQQIQFTEKAVTNAQTALTNTAAAIGWNGVLQHALATGDPTAVQRIESTMGPGFDLHAAATHVSLDDQYKQAEINKLNRPNLQFVPGTANQPGGTFNQDTGVFTPTTGTTKNTQNLATTQANIESINSLLKPGAMSGVGTNSVFRYDPLTGFTGKQQNFLAGVNQIKDQLTLDSLTKAKQNGATFGALSDGERSVLANSASKLGSWEVKDKNGNVIGYNASQKDFTTELNKINNYAKLDYVLKGGDAASIGVVQQGDGSYWTQNSDGTYTKIQ